MNFMFNGCTSLYSLPDISQWNTNNVTDMNNMFYGCSKCLKPNVSKKFNVTYK